MIESGEYLVQFYSRKGTKIRELTEKVTSLTEARALGEDILILEHHLEKVPLAVSFTVDRRVHNSIDKQDTWQ